MRINLNLDPDHYVAPKNLIQGNLNPMNFKVGIVCAKFNSLITKSLLMGAIQGLSEHGMTENQMATYFVPGAFEVPLLVDQIFPTVDAVIAIACVIKGDTPHFDYVCQGITSGLTTAIHTHQKPGIFCVLTTNTIEQAQERAQPNSVNNKGYEAAIGALEMLNISSSIRPLSADLSNNLTELDS